MNTRLIFVHALSPLHAGTGQGVGVIDLPIAREKATGIPYLPGSSLKGVLRESCPEEERIATFGPEPTNAEEYASSVQFSDQRLLLLPIRSLKGTFAWVTSPYLLRRFARETQDVGLSGIPTDVPDPAEQQALVPEQGTVLAMNYNQRSLVVLEDLDLQATPHAETGAWAAWLAQQVFPTQAQWQTELSKRLCVIHDDVFGFLLTTATEIIARIKLKDATKTVQQGGLWYEEALPAETILSGLVAATPTKKAGKTAAQVFATVTNLTQDKTLQVGGNATVGRGLCRIQIVGQEGR
jgi:CRISPR-associated protein Cmr4